MVEDHTNANSYVNAIVSVNHKCHCVDDNTFSFHYSVRVVDNSTTGMFS